MDVPLMHINLFNAIVALYLIGYQITICSDWSWIPLNEEDYKLPYQEKLNIVQKQQPEIQHNRKTNYLYRECILERVSL